MSDANDLSAGFMARSQDQATSAADDQLNGILSSYANPQGQNAPAPMTPPPDRGSVMGNVLKYTNPIPVVKDVAGGLLTSPVQAIGGVMDAVGNAAKGLDHLGDWLNAHVANLTIGSGDPGALGDPLKAISAISGAVGAPQTYTGAFIREGAKFLTGFLPAMRASRAVGLGAAGSSIAAGAVAGATVLDPSDPNLSATIAKNVTVPASLKPAVDLLSTNPDDPEIVNRARNMVENAGFGMITEGVFRGVKALVAARRAMAPAAEPALDAEGKPIPPPAPDPLAAAKAEYGETKPEDFSVLGDPAKPAVSVSKVAAKKLEAGAAATDGRVSLPTEEGGQVYINFARMNEPDDVKGVLDKMASAFKGSIDEAKRGVQSHEETAKLADSLGMSVDDLLQRNKGQPFNAEQSLAARNLWQASAQKLMETAEKAASPNAGAVDQYNFRRMMAIHSAVQSEVIAARTETARALNAWAIPSQAGVEQSRAIKLLLEQNGGEAVSIDLAKKIASLKAVGVTQDGINAAVRKGWFATSADMVREAFTMGLLWLPPTHMTNVMSNSIVLAQKIEETSAASRIAIMRGTTDGVAPGEAAAAYSAINSSLRDAFTLAWRSMKTGETGGSLGKTELPRQRAISSATVARERGMNPAQAQQFAQTGLGRAIDYIGYATNIPGRLLSGEDEFFKTIAYRMELHQQAIRTATEEGLSGSDFLARVADVTANPPENIKVAASDAALYSTFQNQAGTIVRSLMNIRQATGPVGTVLMPFLKTPGNILSYTFERTPAAPLVSRWRADVAAGGARRDLALARVSTGSALMMSAFDLADSGLITGPGPSKPGDKEALIRTGWQPNSFKIGGKYVSYNRMDPVAMPMAFAAAASERWKQAETSPEDLNEWSEALAAATAITSETVIDKTWFQSISNIVGVIQNSQQGAGALTNFINQETGSLVPFSSGLTVAKRFTDPVTRQIMNPYDAIMAKFPILSQQLPARHDLWGQDMKPDEVFGRAYDVLSPLAVRETKDSPIDSEMVRLQSGKERIGVLDSFDGVHVNFRDFPNVYDRYTRLAGNELKHPAFALGAKDLLDQTVSGVGVLSPAYKIQPDQGKADMISRTIDEYRQLAQMEIKRHPVNDEERNFLDYVAKKKADAQAARLPAFLQGSR